MLPGAVGGLHFAVVWQSGSCFNVGFRNPRIVKKGYWFARAVLCHFSLVIQMQYGAIAAVTPGGRARFETICETARLEYVIAEAAELAVYTAAALFRRNGRHAFRQDQRADFGQQETDIVA